jgi:hypothetical protein
MHANTALCLVTILGNQALLFAPDSDPEQKNYAYSVARTGDHIPKRPTKQRKKDVLAPKNPFSYATITVVIYYRGKNLRF